MARQTFKTVDVLKLEVENTATGLTNLVQNPSGDLGGWGWVTPTATTSMDKDYVAGNLQFLSYTSAGTNSNGSGTDFFYTEDFALTAGQWVAARYVLKSIVTTIYGKARFEFLNAAGATLTPSAQSAIQLAGTGGTGTTYTYAAVQAPAGTVRARLRFDVFGSTLLGGGPTSPGDSLRLRDVTVAKASTSGALTGLGTIAPATYTNVLGPTHTISVKRDELSVSTLTAEILDATLDPSQSSLIRPGKRCRLMVLDTVQTVAITGSPTGGTFALAAAGHTATIAWNAASSTVQTAVRAWGGLFAAVTVTSAAGGPYTFAFPSGPAGPLTVNQSNLTGGTASASQATVIAWTPLFTGKVSRGEASYDPKRTDAKKTRITLTALDAATTLAQVTASSGVGTIAELPFVLEGCGVPWNVNGSGNQVATATVVTTSPDASAIDQIAITRDSVLGYAWLDRTGILNAWDRASIDATSVTTISESAYSDLSLDYDTDRCINTVTVKLRRVNLATGQTAEVTYGPYVDQDSVDQWGPHAAEFTVQGIADSDAAASAYAASILTANGTPAVRINSVSVPIRNITDVVPTRALLDLYDLVTVANTNAGISTDMRVTGLEHTIESGRWTLEIDLTVVASVAIPQDVTPVGGLTSFNAGSSSTNPDVAIGAITMFGAATAPTGYLLCDGSAVSRTTYAALFAVIGTNFGVGNGSTTFNVPNFKGRVPTGFDSGQTEFNALAKAGGAKTVNIDHAHVKNAVGQTLSTFNFVAGSGVGSSGNFSGGMSQNTDPSVLQPYITLNFIIRAL